MHLRWYLSEATDVSPRFIRSEFRCKAPGGSIQLGLEHRGTLGHTVLYCSGARRVTFICHDGLRNAHPINPSNFGPFTERRDHFWG